MTGHLYYWVADWNLSRAQAALRLGNAAVDMVDCTHDALPRVKQTTIRRFAGYVTGTQDIQWSASDFATLPAQSAFLRIDQSNGTLPLRADVRLVKDVEPGASDILNAVTVADERVTAGEDYIIYCSEATLPHVELEVSAKGMSPGHIIAYQYASPTSNPNTRLPGTIFSLKEANADLSVILPQYLPLPKPPPPPPEKLPQAQISFDPDDGSWTIHGIPFGVENAGK